MTQKRQTQTKALSAYLKARHTSLSSALARIGLDQAAMNGETIDDDITGRIARLLGLTPERLVELAAPYALA
jgi:hypothetical protein